MKKRLLSGILSALMLLGTVTFTSCGDKTPEPEKSKVDHVYKALSIDIGDNINPRELINAGDKLIVYASEITDRENYEYQSIFMTIDPKSGDYEKNVIPKADDSSYIQKLAATSDGSIIFLMQNYDSETNSQTYSITTLENDSFVTLCPDVSTLFESDGENSIFGGGQLYIDYFAVDKDDNIYLTCDYAILVLDKNFNKLFELEVGGYIRRLGSTSDGRVYISYYDNGDSQIRYIDTEKKDFGDKIQLPETSNVRNAEFYVGAGYDLYYKDDSSVYGFNSEDGEPVELLNFVNSDVNPGNIQELVVYDADTMLCCCYDFYSEESSYELLLMKRIPEKEIQEKYVIKLAYIPSGANTLESLAVAFNRASDEYRIELINYLQYGNDDDYTGSQYLESQILDGTAPDIINVSDFENSDNWIEQGAFTDLTKLMEKDEIFDRSNYFDCIFTSYTDQKGRMYQFVTNFNLETILANANIIDFDTWNAEKCIDFISNLPDDKFIMSYFSQNAALYLPIAASMDTFIDYENATCSFDSELFKKLLEKVKNVPEDLSYYASLNDEEKEDYSNNPTKPYLDGTILFEEEYFYRLRDYASALVQFGEDNETIFLGFPTNNGNGTLLIPQASYSINEKSILKEGAWEFIKYASASASSSMRSIEGFPACIEAFDKMCEDEIGSWYYFYPNGSMGFGSDSTYEEVLERVQARMNRNPRMATGTIVQISKEHTEALHELINGAQASPNMQSKVFEIINEEAELYYSNAKSLDETVKIIQDRVSTYISENS